MGTLVSVQDGASALLTRLQTTRAATRSTADAIQRTGVAGQADHGAKADLALRLTPDHPMGAGHGTVEIHNNRLWSAPSG